MNTNPQPKRSKKGFTLIEMIGVLAVIAILAALLIPKIFEAINNARVSNSALACNTVKTAVADHYAKFGTLLSSNGVLLTIAQFGTNFDRALLIEGFLDKPFNVKIGDGNQYVGIANATNSTVVATVDNASYALSGDATVNDAAGAVVVQAIISGVVESDARALSLQLDGATMSTAIGTADTFGRVKYAATSPTTVYVYITHR